MTRKKTVIVIGAGASQEAGLPTGAELKKEIASRLNLRVELGLPTTGDLAILQALQSSGDDLGPYIRACRQISEALPLAISIDNFIDDHQGNQEIEYCGKIAIVRSILEAERQSLMHVPNHRGGRMRFETIEETWFNKFWQKLRENCRAEQLEDRFSSIVLIIFNYDRCVEHFLYHSILKYYRTSSEDAVSLVNAIKIFHPYGMVGSLPWTDRPNQMSFGGEPNAHDLVALSRNIQTFAEGTNPEVSDVEAVWRHVLEANTLIFLGFSYQKQNLEMLLQPLDNADAEYPARTTCLGTAHNISNIDCRTIEDELRIVSGQFDQIALDDLKCREFFDKYWRTLSDYLR